MSDFILAVAVSAIMAIVMVEWLAGCGETYTDSNGVKHSYECVYFNR